MQKKKILILNTGGTLSSVMKDNGLAPGLTTENLQKELHMISQGTDLSMMDLFSLDSANIFPEDWASMAAKITEYKDDVDGIVLIHGTDTLAYTSSMLSFMLQNIDIPVVITGSQLSMSDPIADAMENCRCAIHMAASGYPGVYVAFNRKVMLGCRTSKVRSMSFDAFDSINYPNVAQISSLGMEINEQIVPKKHHIFHLENQFSDKVFMLKMFPGIHRSMLRSIRDQGYEGLYIEAYGLGGMPFIHHDFTQTIQELIQDGMTVLVGTQVRYEGSSLSVYETGRKALEAGVLQAYDMTSEAAMTKLMWVLGKTKDPKQIRDYFNISLCGEVNMDK